MAQRISLAHVLTYNFLYEQYVHLNKPSNQIGAEVGCNGKTVRDYLAFHGIPRNHMPRNPSRGIRSDSHRAAFLQSGVATRFSKGQRAPQTGKTKETDDGVARSAKAKVGIKRPQWSGVNHPLWKGDAVSEARRVRDSAEYKAWRRTVFQRDNYTCQKCGKRGCKLEAHHKNLTRRLPALAGRGIVSTAQMFSNLRFKTWYNPLTKTFRTHRFS